MAARPQLGAQKRGKHARTAPHLPLVWIYFYYKDIFVEKFDLQKDEFDLQKSELDLLKGDLIGKRMNSECKTCN